MSDKADHAVVSGTPVKPKKRQTCMRHCKRFWWLYLIIFICIVVLVVCLIIFVAVPKIAQHKIDDAKLEIQGVHVIQTESNAFQLDINSTITTDGSIKAQIDAFEGVLYLEDLEPHTPFVKVHFPATNGDKHQNVNISQHIDIADLAAFTDFNVWFANNKTLRITVEGDTKVKPSGLSRKYDVTFKQTVEIDGLDLFSGTRVIEKESHIDREAAKNETNFRGFAEIPNHSVFTLELGNASFANFVDESRVGLLEIENFTLRPGTNRVPITAILNQTEIVSLVRTEKYCKDGVLPFKMIGNGNVKNEGQELSYFATALASANQTIPIDIGSIIKADFGFALGCPK